MGAPWYPGLTQERSEGYLERGESRQIESCGPLQRGHHRSVDAEVGEVAYQFLVGVPLGSTGLEPREEVGQLEGCLLYTSDAADE